MKRLTVIVDLQFGSCGKGLLAGYLAEREHPDAAVIAWGPNSGHTYINAKGEKFVNIALPNSVVAPSVKKVFLGPGSVINPVILQDELNRYRGFAEFYIHEHAAVALPHHREAEANAAYKIGSTMKGVGEAVIQKIRRDPDAMNIARVALPKEMRSLVVSRDEYNRQLDMCDYAIVEGSQGFSLGINQGMYPYVTSRDCTTMQILNDCAIPMGDAVRFNMEVIGVARTFPIRVANRFDDKGVQIGWSGPCYPDQVEISWEQLGIPPELTTVTKLPRRVFTFSYQQVVDAVRMNGVHGIFLNFMNYMDTDAAYDLARMVERRTGARVMFTGWGPKSTDILEWES